jgi:PAS domain S-box-containing protein
MAGTGALPWPRETQALRDFISESPGLLAMLDVRGSYMAASRRWVQTYGRGHTALIGVSFYDIYPEEAAFWRVIHGRCLAGEIVASQGERRRGPNGVERWLRWSVLPWRDASGTVAGLVMWVEDITDGRRADADRRESELKYSTIFNEAPFGIVLTRWHDSEVVDANAAFLKMFELTRDDVIGKTSVEIGLMDLESQAQLEHMLESDIVVRDFECTRTTRTGGRRQLSLNVDWVGIGGQRHVLTTIRDLTEIKQARETAHLLEKTKELDDLKTRFFASVSHELRTPLTLILGPIERMLSSPETTDAERHDLTVVARNARTLLEHVNDLLDVSKLEIGHMSVEYTNTNVCRLVRFVAAHFEGIATDKAIHFAVDVPLEAVVAQIDADKVRRVVLNVLSNAFKFTPAAGRVRISLRHDHTSFRIDVADSGPGIPPEMRQLVFEPFRQLEAGPTRRFGGTGLGLAIAREFVTMHGGTIRADDAPEGGALVVVELPLFAPMGVPVRTDRGREVDSGEEVQQVVRGLRDLPPARAGRVGQRGALVLVVEDNAEMNFFISEHLALDHRVETAYDGKEGLRKTLALRPDLVLTDIMMPEMDGEQLVRAIREHSELDHMPVVLLSAKADEALRVRLLRAGAQDYVNKPFVMAELHARIDNLIARKRADERSAQLQRQLQDVMEASKSVSEAVASLPEASVSAVLHSIAMEAQALTGAEYVAVGIGANPELAFDPWVVIGIDPAHAETLKQQSVPARVLGISTSGPARLRDVREQAGFLGFPRGQPILSSLLAMPIRYHGELVGTLYLANKRGAEEFSEHDELLVGMLAERVGVAIVTARVYREVGMKGAWLHAVLEQMPEAVVLVDTTGEVTMQNHAAVALMTESSCLDLRTVTGERLEPDEAPLAQAIHSQRSTRALELVAHTDGHEVPVLVSATPVRMADGQLAGAAMVLQDISTLKELDRLREEWASVVAHDLQQPINAIVLLTEVLLRSPLEPRDHDRVERVRTLSFRLSRMVSDLSDASQLEAHRLEVGHERIDMSTLVREVVERLPDVSPRARIAISDEHMLVRGDAGRLEQVLSNLLSNAVKYGARDTPIVVDISEEDHCAHVAITNVGAGIAPGELPFLFKRFVRSREARLSGIKGSGLGLFIAKGIIEAHGGRIWAESTPNRTTTFHFTIPLAGDETAAQAHEPAPPTVH